MGKQKEPELEVRTCIMEGCWNEAKPPHVLCWTCAKELESKCVFCWRPVTWKFDVCAECEKIYGVRQSDRPEWAKFLLRSQKTRKKQMERGSKEFREISATERRREGEKAKQDDDSVLLDGHRRDDVLTKYDEFEAGVGRGHGLAGEWAQRSTPRSRAIAALVRILPHLSGTEATMLIMISVGGFKKQQAAAYLGIDRRKIGKLIKDTESLARDIAKENFRPHRWKFLHRPSKYPDIRQKTPDRQWFYLVAQLFTDREIAVLALYEWLGHPAPMVAGMVDLTEEETAMMISYVVRKWRMLYGKKEQVRDLLRAKGIDPEKAWPLAIDAVVIKPRR